MDIFCKLSDLVSDIQWFKYVLLIKSLYKMYKVTSAVYHTFIATCRMRALSFCEFLKKYFTAILNERTDYENLTPVLLG